MSRHLCAGTFPILCMQAPYCANCLLDTFDLSIRYYARRTLAARDDYHLLGCHDCIAVGHCRWHSLVFCSGCPAAFHTHCLQKHGVKSPVDYQDMTSTSSRPHSGCGDLWLCPLCCDKLVRHLVSNLCAYRGITSICPTNDACSCPNCWVLDMPVHFRGLIALLDSHPTVQVCTIHAGPAAHCILWASQEFLETIGWQGPPLQAVCVYCACVQESDPTAGNKQLPRPNLTPA